MIYAELQNGKKISAAGYSQILTNQGDLQTKNILHCPGCKERVFFKNGEQKISHFSHYRESNCLSFSEGETQAHLSGKIKLLEWCEKQSLSVEMEAWLPKLKQRPDLLITLADDRKIALEYQCSPIPSKKIKERTEGYHSIGCEVLWICGVDYIPGTRLLDKHTNFFTWSEKLGCGLICLDSKKGLLLNYRQFYFNQWNQLQYTVEYHSLDQLNFNEFYEVCTGGSLHKQHSFIHIREKTQRTMKQSKILLLLRRKDEHHRKFLEKIYLQRQELQNLPDLLFIYPIKSVYWQTPAYIWKYMFLCWLQDMEEGETIDTELILIFLKECKSNKIITLRSSNFIPEDVLTRPLFIFINELVQENILTIIGEGLWFINKKLF